MHSVPNARNSRTYEGRPPCVGYGTCSPVCPSGAKYSADVHIDDAESKGARIIDRAVVRRLETDESGSRITGATYETPDRTTHTQTADQFLLAAGAIENARLLLLSSSPEHPNGLANSSGAVGKYLMEHPYVGIVGQFDVETSVNRIGFGTSESYQFYEPDDPPPGAFKIEFSNSTSPSLPELALEQKDPLVHMINTVRGDRAAAADLRSDTQPIEWGDDLLERLKESSYGHSFRIVAEIEVLPNADNRVTLNPDETDKFGDPVPDVSWGSFTEYAESAMDRAFEVLEEILSAVDAEVVSSSRFEHRQGVGHNSGTTRMGTDPETSVVDMYHRSHDVQNLFIAGASTFVTLGAGQPTLTIAATSLRLADYLDREVL
jgi:choline dehydrogenase-like flavoprotein